MSGQFPTGIEFSSVELDSVETVLTSKSQSGVRQSRLIGGHLWVIQLSTNPMLKSEFNPLYAFMMRQKGAHESFTIELPGHEALGAINGTPTWTSTTDDNTIVTSGWANSIADQVKEGDLFTIAGSIKVYMVTADASSDGSGNATLSFYPALRDTPSASAALTFANVNFTVSLDRKTIGYRRSGLMYSLDALELTEALV